MRTAYGPQIGSPTLTPDPQPESQPEPYQEPEDTRNVTWRTASPDFIEASYADMNMVRLTPHFMAYAKEHKPLQAVEQIPNPRQITTTDPRNIDLVFETPGVEPILAFDAYKRGVAAGSLIVRGEYHQAVKESLFSVAQSVIEGMSLPRIDEQFSVAFTRAERVIFTNGQHSSWRQLIAFAQGAYWILSFVAKPERRRGNYSPLEFITGMVQHYGALAYVPQ